MINTKPAKEIDKKATLHVKVLGSKGNRFAIAEYVEKTRDLETVGRKAFELVKSLEIILKTPITNAEIKTCKIIATQESAENGLR